MDRAAEDGTDEHPPATPSSNPVKRYFWNDPERRLRAPWRLGVGAVAFVLLLVAVGIVVALLPAPDRAARNAPLVRGLYATGLYVGAISVFSVGLVVISYGVDRRRVSDLGLGLDRQWWRDMGFGLGLGVVLPTIVFLLEFATGLVTVTDTFVNRPDAFLGFGPAPAWFALLLVGLVFVGIAVFEELLVRGYLLTNVAEGLAGFRGLDTGTAIGAATVLTAGVFGVLHASNPNATLLSTVNITLFGILLGLGYALTDRLAVPIGLHVTWNATVGSVFGLPVSGMQIAATVLETEQTGPELLTGGDFGPEGGLIALVALVLGLALLWVWVRREYGATTLQDDVARPQLRSGDE
jgi:membrane protease YdiL (CAAX protease family)